MFDINAILGLLPHRYPFVLVDRIIDLTPGEKLTAIKNVTINEPFFHGHFPNQPVMPGVLCFNFRLVYSNILEICFNKFFKNGNNSPVKYWRWIYLHSTI